MASISDFNLTLVNGGLEYSTTDTSFNDSDNTIYIDLKSIPYTNSTGSYQGFSPDGTGSYQLPDWFNYVPLNIEITINDDEDSQLNSLYDSKIYYNITSTSNDLFDPANV